MLFGHKMKTYAFVGPSGTGKSYRAQMIASERGINYIIDDGLLVKDNEIIAGNSAKKAPTKIETVKHALFYDDDEKKPIQETLKKHKEFKLLEEHKLLPTNKNDGFYIAKMIREK